MNNPLAVMLIAGCVGICSSADRGRIRISNNTLVSDRGTVLRFNSMSLGRTAERTAAALTSANWGKVKEHGLNGVRVLIWTLPEGGTEWATRYPAPQDYFGDLDKIAGYASSNGLYMCIDFHGPSYKCDISKTDVYNRIRDFWTAVAPRYKDRTHVFYEIVNEPSWITDAQQQAMVNLYRHLRSLAPNTHICCWGVDRIQGDTHVNGLLNQKPGIDYSNASISFHSYSTTLSSVEKVKAKYPVFNTEQVDLKALITLCEAGGIGWCAWQGQTGNWDEFETIVKSNGFCWTPDFGTYPSCSGSNQRPTVTLLTPSDNHTAAPGSTVLLTALASDPEGAVTRVEYYHEIDTRTTLIGSATGAPYSVSWKLPTIAGAYSLYAVAYDDKGASGQTDPIVVNCGAATTAGRPGPRTGSGASPGVFRGLQKSSVLNCRGQTLSNGGAATSPAGFFFRTAPSRTVDTKPVRIRIPVSH